MYEKSWSNLNQGKMVNYLENVEGKVVLGIDGFIDQVWQVIETRISKDEYKLIDKMKNFGEIIVNRGGGGLSNELVKKRRSYGGFTGNTGKAVGRLDLSTVLIGMYGKEMIDPVFDELKENCTLIAVGNPVVCNILEFTDGKIMMPCLQDLLSFEWNTLVNVLGQEKLQSIFADTDIVALGYWSNMPDFDVMIPNIYENYLAGNRTKRIFFDFANLKKRSVEALKETFNVLRDLNNKIPMTLSLNEHEGALLFSYYDEKLSDDIEKVEEIIPSLREKTGLDELIIHTPYYAIAATKSEGIGLVKQDYCVSPVKTTGAGDTFNAGYIASCIGNLDINERLAIANASTSFYVNNGFPACREDLIKEVKRIKEKLS